MLTLPYTICFCYRGDLVLMLYRNRPPNQRLWNGLGGKIQPGETPFACVQLAQKAPQEYYCDYQAGTLEQMIVRPLPTHVTPGTIAGSDYV